LTQALSTAESGTLAIQNYFWVDQNTNGYRIQCAWGWHQGWGPWARYSLFDRHLLSKQGYFHLRKSELEVIWLNTGLFKVLGNTDSRIVETSTLSS